jgi:poly(3-hydroxybutyrate) depolymerase
MPLDGVLNLANEFTKAQGAAVTHNGQVLRGLQHEAGDMARHFSRQWLSLIKAACSAPFNPMAASIPGQMAQGWLQFSDHLLAKHEKQEFDFTVLDKKSPRTYNNKPVDVQIDIVDEQPYGRLKHFTLTDENGHALKVQKPSMLLIAPMSSHFDTLLTGTVHELMMDYDLYITDWTDVKEVSLAEHGEFDLNTYIHYLKDQWLPLINRHHHGVDIAEQDISPAVHTMAVCQPGVPLMAAASMMSEDNDPHRPVSMTLMGSPIDTRINPTEVNKAITERDIQWFRENAFIKIPSGYPGAGQTVYPGVSNLFGFMMTNYQNHMEAHFEMALGDTFDPWNERMTQASFDSMTIGDKETADTRRHFYEEYRRIMDMSAAYLEQTLKAAFTDCELPNGKMVYTDPQTGKTRPIKTEAIRDIAILALEGEKDDITGLGQTRASHTITPSLPDHMKSYHMQKDVGHYGLFNGNRWRTHIAPRIINFTSKANERNGLHYPIRNETSASLTREGLVERNNDGLDLTA